MESEVKQQDHSMSHQQIYNLQTSSLPCTELVYEKESRKMLVKKDRGVWWAKRRSHWWVANGHFLSGLSYVDQIPGDTEVWTDCPLPPSKSHIQTHPQQTQQCETSLKRSSADHVIINYCQEQCSAHMIALLSLFIHISLLDEWNSLALRFLILCVPCLFQNVIMSYAMSFF